MKLPEGCYRSARRRAALEVRIAGAFKIVREMTVFYVILA